MPKYLLNVNYTFEGVKGLLKDGGTVRRKVVDDLVEGLGGKVESFYFCFGKYDVVAIVDLPDNEAVTAASLTVGAAGAAEVQTTTLLSAADVDRAVKRRVEYTAPGAVRRRAAPARAASAAAKPKADTRAKSR